MRRSVHSADFVPPQQGKPAGTGMTFLATALGGFTLYKIMFDPPTTLKYDAAAAAAAAAASSSSSSPSYTNLSIENNDSGRMIWTWEGEDGQQKTQVYDENGKPGEITSAPMPEQPAGPPSSPPASAPSRPPSAAPPPSTLTAAAAAAEGEEEEASGAAVNTTATTTRSNKKTDWSMRVEAEKGLVVEWSEGDKRYGQLYPSGTNVAMPAPFVVSGEEEEEIEKECFDVNFSKETLEMLSETRQSLLRIEDMLTVRA